MAFIISGPTTQAGAANHLLFINNNSFSGNSGGSNPQLQVQFAPPSTIADLEVFFQNNVSPNIAGIEYNFINSGIFDAFGDDDIPPDNFVYVHLQSGNVGDVGGGPFPFPIIIP